MQKIKLLSISVLLSVGVVSIAQADTIGNYMTLVNNIPSMAMKPDEQSQAWVRSARSILISTDETMAQTVSSMNGVAIKTGHPIFCLPQGGTLDAGIVDDIIQKTYANWVATQGESPSMPVSDILTTGLMARYPCSMSLQPSPMATSPMAAPNGYNVPTQASISIDNNNPPVL